MSSNTPSYMFALQDSDSWLRHLASEGYVVIKQALSPEEVLVAKNLLWKDFEETSAGLSRDDIESWKSWKLSRSGLNPDVAQGKGAWHVRACPGVSKAFSQIWETSDLIVSMDCAIAWRPWWLESSWKPRTEGLHLDQNPFTKPGRECVQGMVPLLPVSNASGGLQVVPQSHTDEAKEALKREYPHLLCKGDWCMLNDSDFTATLLLAGPGDLILWDSRTVHGGLVGTGDAQEIQANSSELARLAVAVSMVPRAWAGQLVQQARIEGFQHGRTFNHSPHEAGTSSGTMPGRKRTNFVPIELSEAQRALL